MTTKNLIESLLVLFAVWSIRLAFLAAGCWMMYNGWYGCGMTTVIFSILVGGHHDSDEDDEKEEKDLSSARSCVNCSHRICEANNYFTCSLFGDFPQKEIVPCYRWHKKEEQK